MIRRIVSGRVAVPVGLLIGTGLAKGIVTAASTETVRLPFMISLRSYATAVLVVLVSSTVSFAVVSRGLRHLDLLGVLKARD